jgi:hypothetical protein
VARVQNAISEAGASRNDAMRINVTRDGRFYFRNTIATSAELLALMQTAFAAGFTLQQTPAPNTRM